MTATYKNCDIPLNELFNFALCGAMSLTTEFGVDVVEGTSGSGDQNTGPGEELVVELGSDITESGSIVEEPDSGDINIDTTVVLGSDIIESGFIFEEPDTETTIDVSTILGPDINE